MKSNQFVCVVLVCVASVLTGGEALAAEDTNDRRVGAHVPSRRVASSRVYWPGLEKGTRFLANVEVAIRTDVDVPVVLAVEYDYRTPSGPVVPAGSRVFGHLSQVSHDGFLQLHVDSLLLAGLGTVSMDATVVSLSGGALKGKVYQRKRFAKALARAGVGKGYSAAQAALGRHWGGRSYRRAFIRHSLSHFVGRVTDEYLYDASRERRRLVVVPANTRVFVVLRQAIPGMEFQQ